MKRTEPEHVSDLLRDLVEQNDFFKLAGAHNELIELWDSFPDPTFARLSLEMQLSTDGKLTVLCPSSVSLNYLRLRRKEIENHLSSFMKKHDIKELILSLKN